MYIIPEYTKESTEAGIHVQNVHLGNKEIFSALAFWKPGKFSDLNSSVQGQVGLKVSEHAQLVHGQHRSHQPAKKTFACLTGI